MSTAPAHLLVAGTERHGVSVLARQLADEVGAPVVTDAEEAARSGRVHVHFSDRLFGSTPAEAARRFAAMARHTRVTVTLHDVPQPTDGDAFEQRRACYAAVCDASAAWLVSSEAEHATVRRHCRPRRPGSVVHLPVWAPAVELLAGSPGEGTAAGLAPGEASVGVFGWIYPGKGHAEALAAAALIGSSARTRPRVVAVGAVAEGHQDLMTQLRATAADLDVRFEHTGWLPDDDVARVLAGTTVGFAGHGNVSASGSVNQWLAAGRRPLVRSSRYMREIAALRPGTVELYPADADAGLVAERIARRLRRPDLGRLDPGVAVRPTLADVGRAYRRWWGA